MKRELLFMRIGDDRFVVGVSLEQMLSSINELPSIYGGREIKKIEREDVPKKYSWSIRRAEEYRDWEERGAYQLVPHFETSNRFSKYFPKEQI